MTSPIADRPRPRPRASRAPSGGFARLGRGLVRHPWYPVLFWIVLAAIALPFLMRLSGAEANSATTLPASAPSAVASAELARLFPSASAGGSTSVVLLQGTDLTGPSGQNATIGVAQRIASDRNLTDLAAVSTLYSDYAEYLGGVAELSIGVVGESEAGSSAFAVVNASAALAWGPPDRFLSQWESLVAAHPSTPPRDENAPAYASTASALSGDAPALEVLRAFYGQPGGSGWNGTQDCAGAPASASDCAISVVRSGAVLAALGPADPALPDAGTASLENLDLSNYSQPRAVEIATEAALVNGTSIPLSFVETVRAAFPAGAPSALELAAWSASVADATPVAGYPVPIPAGLLGEYVDPGGNATVVIVTFSVPSGYTNPSGSDPVFADVREIDRLLPGALEAADPTGGISAWQTGDAALNAQESSDLSADLAIVLPLTIVVLIVITMAYFRSPLTPLVTFGTLGIALVLAFAGVVALAAFVTKVDPTALTLATTFVLGVGTDYSVFLVARYREELVGGASPDEAVVTTVTWAGQSIATSGATAILATLALAFSGVGLLSQWGLVLSLSVLLTLLASLTLVPALLVLLGPRLFWPDTGARFAERAAAERARIAARRTYFYRASARSHRHPTRILLVVLALSVPLIYVALQAPLNYDFYAQLPSGEPASNGLRALGPTFGAGYAFPSYVLVTFRSDLISSAGANATEIADLVDVTALISTTPGVAVVRSPIGPYGAPEGAWARYGTSSPLEQKLLVGVLGTYLGEDGRTVRMGFQSTSSGLSIASVSLVNTLRASLTGYAHQHPDVAGLAFGGGAQTTADLEAQTALATERMVAAVTIGLLLVLFVVLRSYWIPPMAVATIGLSIAWAWATTYLVIGVGFADPLFYFVPTVLFLLILGLGIDYNIFLLTRVREERLAGRSSSDAASEGVARTGGIITAAAIILASAFAVLITGRFLLLQAIGFSVAVAILLDAMVVRTYLVPALLHLGGERVWAGPRFRPSPGPLEARGPDDAGNPPYGPAR